MHGSTCTCLNANERMAEYLYVRKQGDRIASRLEGEHKMANDLGKYIAEKYVGSVEC